MTLGFKKKDINPNVPNHQERRSSPDYDEGWRGNERRMQSDHSRRQSTDRRRPVSDYDDRYDDYRRSDHYPDSRPNGDPAYRDSYRRRDRADDYDDRYDERRQRDRSRRQDGDSLGQSRNDYRSNTRVRSEREEYGYREPRRQSRYDDDYDRGRNDDHDDRRVAYYDDNYDDYNDYDDNNYDDYDDNYDDEDYGKPTDSRATHRSDRSAMDGRTEKDVEENTTEEDDEDNWASRWSSWVPEDAFSEGNEDDSDIEESEFGEEYEDGPRKNQNLPQVEQARQMAEVFVDKFRNGGTIGWKTSAKRIVRMLAVAESDIPLIKRRLRRSNIPYNIMMAICATVVLGASGYLYNYFHSLSQNDIQMDAITAQYTTPIAPTPTDIEATPMNETDMPPIVDFAGLKNLNSEVSSWLRVPGTTIDYPVMTTPVESKYLRLDIEGNYSIPGCLFTDWDNWNENMDLVNEKHIVIYGHHLPWPAMFHDMSLYLEEPGFVDGHRKMYYETPEQTYVLSVIGVHKAAPSETDARRTIFSDQEEFQRYIDDRLALNGSVYDSHDYDRKTIGKLFTFITCTDSGAARCIVNAIVVEQYPTSYVPLVRAKMQNLIKADGTIDPVKEAQLQAEKEAEALAQQQAEEQQQEAPAE